MGNRLPRRISVAPMPMAGKASTDTCPPTDEKLRGYTLRGELDEKK